MQPAETEFAAPFKRPAPHDPLRLIKATGHRCCLECGAALSASSPREAEFCCTPCRMSWNNRRAARGAQVYDLLMALRFERGPAKVAGVWSILCALCSAFRDADRAARGGRRSWRKTSDAIAALPLGYSTGGDRR